MSVLRQQFVRTTSVTVAASPNVTVVDLLGPETALASPYAEGSDHVVDPRQVRQNEAGWAVVDGWFGSALAVAALTVDVEIWSRGSTAAQRNMQAPLFPSGAAVAADPVLKRVVATGLAGNGEGITAVFGGEDPLGATLSSVDAPKLHLRADEFVRLRIANTGALVGPVVLTAKYDLGNNPKGSSLLA